MHEALPRMEKRGSELGDGKRGGQPLPLLSRISSQAECEEALESGESEALSLIESHASVTCKALQSRKDLGATEPQTPPPSSAPPWTSCLSSPPLTPEHNL